MPINPNTAQMQFERNKDDKRTQALLDLLGKMRDQVIDYEIRSTRQETTYKVTFYDGKEMRGSIVPSTVEGEYTASEAKASEQGPFRYVAQEIGGYWKTIDLPEKPEEKYP